VAPSYQDLQQAVQNAARLLGRERTISALREDHEPSCDRQIGWSMECSCGFQAQFDRLKFLAAFGEGATPTRALIQFMGPVDKPRVLLKEDHYSRLLEEEEFSTSTTSRRFMERVKQMTPSEVEQMQEERFRHFYASWRSHLSLAHRSPGDILVILVSQPPTIMFCGERVLETIRYYVWAGPVEALFSHASTLITVAPEFAWGHTPQGLTPEACYRATL